MTLTEETAHFLISPDGRNLLAHVSRLAGDVPRRILDLRKQGVASEVAAAAVEVADARHRARFRFFNAADLFFTPDMLAQATSPALSAYHAARLAPCGTVADLGCGAGMDIIALARAGANVLAIERDPARLVFAQANALACGVADQIQFVLGDATALDWTADAAFFDPARRVGDKRVSRHADQYEPPLSFLETIQARTRHGVCVKLSPALPDDVLVDLGGRVEFLSENRECKEACVWLGELAGDTASPRAVLLPEGEIVDSSELAPIAPAIGAFVHDPDPAIIRAGALGTLAHRINAALVSAADAYLTGDSIASPARLASSYQIWENLPYKPRVVGELLRACGVGRLVVKKRHYPHEPGAVHKELGLSGKSDARETTLILVREEPNKFRAILCEPVK